ncbi:MAG: mannose-1-phosphate guanylyltransferase/mannose-6-phosphate isomerase [Alphaproteobacteria bacterium]|nr:mannose-1-phosphate guanylyltransferase/mannose-6-phosphate isomerase [Alphaproteobacteria bacterium]
MARLIHPVILSGGAGTRLWPVSRELRPKQFLSLTSDRTILQETVLRVGAPARFAGPTLVASEEHRFLVAEQMRQIGIAPSNIVLEPVGRSTAPAIAAAALLVAETDPDAVLLVLPSDHQITDLVAFHAAIDKAASAALRGKLVTFGIAPDGPRSGFGYIRMGTPLEGTPGVYAIERFVEKPPEQTARAMLDEGGWSWNSGMFAFTAKRYLEELAQFQPAMLAAVRESVASRSRDLEFTRLDKASFAKARELSIDYAVMEKTADAAVVPADLGWSDLGSWNAMYEAAPHDAAGNALSGKAVIHDVGGSYIASDGPLVGVLGLKNVVVVATKDAVLVTDRARAEGVKDLVAKIKEAGRDEHRNHREFHRPWGTYETIDIGERFQVKRIVVKPGASLSLQMHHHRAEHWIVVQGTARVTRGDEVVLLHENQSTYIPLGTKHRLENPGMLPLHLIEVQSGPYLGEDDIVRFDDKYGRAEKS